ncbi:DUF2213 domain-containing protein [Yersinia massiliensis]|uniref:DUF2213 domain-containing protein n=1 Tax=Yersinia massiliensis TaxID=419257 RepID=UPI001CFE1ABF|nr:DUF2213 domain-containing protein [Yersinia massiliensis]MCB5318629.1 DUF2213 domain-containing protein [Yersinia massiliensis]
MPIREVTLKGGRKGYRWGAHGKIYPTREQAEKQGAAAFSNGYTGDDAVESFALDSLPEITKDEWVTLNGGHVFLDKDGNIQKNPSKQSSASAKTKSNNKPSLTANEKTNLSSYSGDDFLRINNAVRSGDTGLPEVSRLDSALEKNTVGTSKLYRGMSKADAKKLFPDGQITKGQVVADPAFLSTSKNKSIANMFSVGGVMLEIDSSPTAKGLDMSGLSSNAHEQEVLLPRNSEMVVQSIHPPKTAGAPVIVKVKYRSKGTAGKVTGDAALALDRASSREYDRNGYLRIAQNHITKEQVAPYYGREIPGFEALDLDPEKIYYGYRPWEEIVKAVDTFNGVPILIVHKLDSADNPLKEERIGSVGTTPVLNRPYLDNAFTFTDKSGIAVIEDGSQKEVSAGYFFTPDFSKPGEFEGVHYDFIFTDLTGNHVTVVPEGRCGPDVHVQDAMPSKPIKVQKIMQLTRKQVAVRATLAAYLKPRLTMDAAPADLTKLVGSYKKPSTLAKAVVRQYGNKIAQDMEIEPEELAELMEAAEEVVEPEEKKPVETEETIFDEDNVSESLKEILEGKVPDEVLAKILACVVEPVVGDELTEEEKVAKEKADKDAADAEAARKKKEGEPAMDANTIKLQARTEAQAHFRNLNEAGRKVRDLVGEVDVMAFDSAEDIYGHALKAKGVKIGQYEKSAYKGMVDMLAANKPSQQPITLDSSLDTFEGQFAGLGNIKIN